MKAALYFLCICVLFTACDDKRTSDKHVNAFKISDVTLLKGPFYTAQQADLKYILAMDVDRLLAPFIKDAGLKPLKENYTNWENTGLDGHIGGHYLSALSFMYAATGEKELKDRLHYMLDWLEKCQNKNGNGYIGGIPDGQIIWKEISEGHINAGTFSLNNGWVPLYNIHKLFAGLYDAYENTESKQALSMLVKLSDWFYGVTKDLSNEQIQTILISEHGGINDVFVDVANVTGNAKYLELAKRLSHNAILNPLLEGKNELTGLHANTQIPKVIGFEKYAQATSNSAWEQAAIFFWKTVVDHWTISIGGNSVREHFHPANDFSSMIESEQGPETCNTYNMLKLTRLLYLAQPSSKYVDYYERALFNHMLSSEHPDKGGFVYFTPMRPRHYRVYSQPHTSFWCCVGSGIESPGKYGEMIYAKRENSLHVNLFIASEVNWVEKDVSIIQQTDFPYKEETQLIVKTKTPRKFELKVRYPEWVQNETFVVKINGDKHRARIDNNGFASINKQWKNNDTISIQFKMKTQIEFLPDSSQWVSFVHGPIVLGAITDTMALDGLWADDSRMGHVAQGHQFPLDKAPTLVVNDLSNINSTIKGTTEPLQFTLNNVQNNKGKSIQLMPFYKIHEARYMVYFPVSTEKEFADKQKELAEKEAEIQALNAQTIDLVWPGEQQPESDHFVKFKKSESGVYKSRHWRHATGYFSYRFKNPGHQACFLRLTYNAEDTGRRFSILVNKVKIASVQLESVPSMEFIDVDYEIPSKVIAKSDGKPIEIKFEAEPGSIAGGIFGVRMMKSNNVK